MDTLLALDIGTSKICVLALALDTLTILADRSRPNLCDVPGLAPGRHEQNPLLIREIAFDLIHQVAADQAVAAKSIIGIAITGQMHGTLLADPELRPLTCLITWRDRRAGAGTTARTPSDPNQPPWPDVADRTGCGLHPGYGGTTLGWLARHQTLPEGARALSICDYLAASLTGVQATEPTHGASWGVLDLTTGQWHDDALDALGIPRRLMPEVRPASHPLAPLSARVAGRLGLPAGIPVCSPLGDNQASVIAAAGLDLSATVINLGTGGQISLLCPEFASVPLLETRPMPFAGYLHVGASLCGGWSYAYLRRFFQQVARDLTGIPVSAEDAYERMNALAARADPGAGGLVADTRFAGERGAPDQRGAWTGIDTENLTPANLIRATIQGVVRELWDMADRAGIRPPRKIVATGNGVRKNPLIPSTIEEVFKAPCVVALLSEEAAVGAACAAAVGLGRFSADEMTTAIERYL